MTTTPWDTTVDPGLFKSNKGWIVQQVSVEPDVVDASGQRLPPMKRDAQGNLDIKSGGRTANVQDKYLEAWRVDSPLGQGGKVRAGEEEKQQGTDTFLVAPERPGTRGRVTVKGKAVFVDSSKDFPDRNNDKWNWPSRGGHKKDPTYVLPSTRDPGEMQKFDKHAGNAADHWMVYEWDTTDPNPANHKHSRRSGLGVPPPNLAPIR
jgi:hypothetical protein